jgi:hypothetical protein
MKKMKIPPPTLTLHPPVEHGCTANSSRHSLAALEEKTEQRRSKAEQKISSSGAALEQSSAAVQLDMAVPPINYKLQTEHC